jgi:putative transcriptional regulator
MEINDRTGDDAAALEIGRRLRQARLNRDLSQSDLAAGAGVSELTIRKMEKGELGHSRSLIRVLRALGLLHNADILVPEESVSPIQQSDRSGNSPQRASRNRSSSSSEWSWGEDQ